MEEEVMEDDDKFCTKELTLRFENLLLRKDCDNFWEIVEVIKDRLGNPYERIAYWNKEKDLIYCNSRHLDSDIIYNFLKIEDLVKKWLLK